MRTLLEIIESAKDGQKPTHDECYWAMLAFEALHGFDSRTILDFPNHFVGPLDQTKWWVDLQASESFNRFKKALDVPPDTYVGVNNDPSNPEYQNRRKWGKNLLDKILGDTKE